MTITFRHKQNNSLLKLEHVNGLIETGIDCNIKSKNKEHKCNEYCEWNVWDISYENGHMPYKYFDIDKRQYDLILIEETKGGK